MDVAQIIKGAGDSVRGLTAAICGGLILLGIALTLWGKKPHAFLVQALRSRGPPDSLHHSFH